MAMILPTVHLAEWVSNLDCKSCPYVKEEYNSRISYIDRLSVHYPEYEDDIQQSCWCDKVGGKLSWNVYCSDSYGINHPVVHHMKKKKRSKRERNEKYKKHLRFLSTNGSRYPYRAIWVDRKWIKGKGYIFLKSPYYKRIYRSNHGGSSKRLKVRSNKRIRRYKDEISKGGLYKKIFDYW